MDGQTVAMVNVYQNGRNYFLPNLAGEVKAGCPSIRAKTVSRTNLSWRCF